MKDCSSPCKVKKIVREGKIPSAVVSQAEREYEQVFAGAKGELGSPCYSCTILCHGEQLHILKSD